MPPPPPRRRPVALAFLVLGGCFYLVPFKYAPSPPESGDALSPMDGSPATGCTAVTIDSEGDAAPLALMNVTVLSATGVGYAGSAYPGATSSAAINRSGLPCTGQSQALAPTDLSSGATGDDPTWTATATTTDGTIGTLDDCFVDVAGACANADACSGNYSLTVLPQSGAVENCGDLDPTRIELEVSFPNPGSTPPPSDCEPGTGRFVLLPLHAFDRDVDGSRAEVLRAVQVSGTGTVTARADVTNVTPVGTMPASLRVARRAQSFRFDTADALANADQVSAVVSGSTGFSAGQVAGNAPFILGEVSEAAAWGNQVDMTWTCGTSGPTRTRPQGYQLRLSDLGCGAAQKLTVRPVLTQGPRRLEWEFYGDLGYREITLLGTNDTFAFSRDSFHVAGRWLGVSGQQAQLQLDAAAVAGVDYCTTGTYTLPQE